MRADPSALAPERLLVFELRGAVADFARAIGKVVGLELIDEQEMAADDDKKPTAYLLVPDILALRQILSLWARWQRDELVTGETPWRDVFSLLRDLRIWGPEDRVDRHDRSILRDSIDGLPDQELVRLEIELVHRRNKPQADGARGLVRTHIAQSGGAVVNASAIPEIAYDALLVDLPVREVRALLDALPGSIASIDPILHIRAQSMVSALDISEAADMPEIEPTAGLGEPILALLDGVPVANHSVLRDHIVVEDVFELEPQTPAGTRVHGTAMASAIVRGDLNRSELPLRRKILAVPILGSDNKIPRDRLAVDLVYLAVSRLRSGAEPLAPQTVIVNLSVGNANSRFCGLISPWARLLDWLASEHGMLFVVSAGNCEERFSVPGFANSIEYDSAAAPTKAATVLRAIANQQADRRIFSPAETVNGLTVGAAHTDDVPTDQRIGGLYEAPYGDLKMANASSALGLGFANSVKPDLLMPGGREKLQIVANNPQHVVVKPTRDRRTVGIRVAAPPSDGRENQDAYTIGTSVAAALASRTCHRIHDALEAAYGTGFTALSTLQRALILKALIAHSAKWPSDVASTIRDTLGPVDPKQHVRAKDNIRRFIGFGVVDADDAVACAADRATFWASGLLAADKIATVEIPVPIAINGQPRPHSLAATLAWFTPISPNRRGYRTARLQFSDPQQLNDLAVKADKQQPDKKQTNRGTLFSRRWSGARAPVVTQSSTIVMTIQRDPDQVIQTDEAIPFGLAVTLEMLGIVEIYAQVRARLRLRLPVGA